MAPAKRPPTRGVDFDRADELYAAVGASNGLRVEFADATGADQRSAIGLAHGGEAGCGLRAAVVREGQWTSSRPKG